MKYQRKPVAVGLVILTLLFCFSSTLALAASFNAAQTFQTRCMGCHTVGKGDAVGPDLKDVSKRRDLEWIVSFVQNPSAKILANDPIATELFNKYFKVMMPPQELTRDEILAIVQFIDAGGEVKAEESPIKKVATATEEDILLGKRLFFGEEQLKNGGPNCISCHTIGNDGPMGGAATNDLTHIYSQLKEKGIDTILSKLAFSVMNPLFSDHPLTEEEIFHMKAFLHHVDQGKEKHTGISRQSLFFALIIGVILLVLVELYWRGSKSQ